MAEMMCPAKCTFIKALKFSGAREEKKHSLVQNKHNFLLQMKTCLVNKLAIHRYC